MQAAVLRPVAPDCLTGALGEGARARSRKLHGTSWGSAAGHPDRGAHGHEVFGVATNQEDVMSSPEGQEDHVTWIGRDRSRSPAVQPLAPSAAAEPPRGNPSRRWLWSIGALVAIALVALLAWRMLG